MLSLRNLARAAPRAVPRLTPTVARALPRASPVALRTAAFSTARVLRSEKSELEQQLSAKLGDEIQFEAQVEKEEQMPSSIQDFIDEGKYEILDVEGKEEVKLVRNYGNEKITISFSVTELPYQDEEMMDEDQALDDSDPSAQQSANTPQPEEDGAEGEEHYGSPTPTHLTVVVEKSSKGAGALSIECTAQDGAVIIDNVHHYSEAAQAFASTPEASHARVDAYAGPAFSTLDEDLQLLMEQYLEERGIGESLATFVPDYVDYKEQKEYQRWLKNVKTFVDM